MRLVAFLLTASVPAVLAAQGTSGAFVVMLGKDTVAVERYTRTADRLEADAILRDRAPVVHRHFVATLDANGTVTRFELANRPANQPTAKPLLAVALTFGGDTAVLQVSSPRGDTTLRVVAPHGVPFVGYSYAIMELFLLRLPAIGEAKVTVPMIPIASGAMYPVEVSRLGRDSAVFDWLGGPTHLRIDGQGRIQGVDASLTTVKVNVTRLPDVDLAAAESRFANRPLGELSPADSVRAAVAGATIAIDYGRPSMRGRKIFGGDPVPWNKVWRTGANFATRFTTSADLVIGGQTVPAGTYTLWTLPSPTGWKLILNKQTKAPCADAASCASPQRANLWGTDYNADSDFVRVDMRTERLPQPVEQLVIQVEPQGAGGILKLEWETTRAWVAFAKSSPAAAAQGGSGAFVVTLGKDTVAVERYTRTASTLTGDMIVRNNAPVVWRHYTASLAADGRVTSYEFTNTRLFARGATQPALHLVGTFTADSTRFAGTFLDSAVSLAAATPGGAMPLVGYSYALYELYFARARAMAGNAQTTLSVISPTDPEPSARLVRVVRPDSATIGFTDESATTAFRLDGAGRILAADGRATSEKFTAIRVATLDLEALKTAFAGRPLGQLSPADSVRTTIGGVIIAVDYSRPSTRGRKIFGDVVPWNQVWRAGANAATRFTTSADLVIGGATVPAGTYTLFTLPSPSGWKLILNKQTKAPCKTLAECTDPRRPRLWGTDYSADSDFVRVDMQVTPLPQPVEQFRIAVEPQGAGGVLTLQWETTRAWVAFARK